MGKVLSDWKGSGSASIDRAIAPRSEFASGSGIIACLGDTVCHDGDGDERAVVTYGVRCGFVESEVF